MSKDETRAEILQVAGAIFAAQGYQKATVRKICGQAGVNVAAIHYYFGDKEQLYVEAVKFARHLIEQRWPLPNWSEDLSSEQRLRDFIQTFLQRLLSPQTSEWQTRLLLREIVEPTRAGEELVREGFQPFFAVLLELLRPLLPVDLPEAVLQQVGFSVMGQCLFYRAHARAVTLLVSPEDRAEHFTVDRLAEHVFRFSLTAVEGLSWPARGGAGGRSFAAGPVGDAGPIRDTATNADDAGDHDDE